MLIRLGFASSTVQTCALVRIIVSKAFGCICCDHAIHGTQANKQARTTFKTIGLKYTQRHLRFISLKTSIEKWMLRKGGPW